MILVECHDLLLSAARLDNYGDLFEYRAYGNKLPGRVLHSDRGDSWASSVEILVFASPTGYMLTTSGFPILNWGIFHKFL